MKRGYARAAGGGRVRVADMSMPPEKRGRKRDRNGKGQKGKRGGNGKTAQLDHAGGHHEQDERRRRWRRTNKDREQGSGK